MPSILITGTNSFVGRNFKLYSKFKDIKYVSLRNSSPSEIDFSGIDTIIHLAAIVHVLNGIDPSEYYRVNRNMTVDLAKQAKSAGVSHFIFMSTVKVYGDITSDAEIWTENSKCNPVDHYGKSKYEAELALNDIEDHSFKISIIRTPIVYGKGMKANMMKLVKLVKYCPVLPLGKINNHRHYTFIGNLIGLIDRIIETRLSGVFIAMDETAVSTTELIMCISSSLNKKTLLICMPQIILNTVKYFFPYNINRLYCSFHLDNSVTLKILNYNPLSTEAGINKMINEVR